MTTKGIYNTLVTQLDKLARHNRQGSFRTKDRYYEAVKRFCVYLAAHYHLQKLENISGKHLARYAGLRIHECFRMDTAAAERALRENALTVKGKGGKVRIVPIEDDRITMMLQRLLEKTERGHKLLVPDGIPTDRAINGMQQFILRHRDAICDPTAADRRITFHGLRHTYAAEKYTSLVSGGMTPLDAHFTVSRLLGHERPDVTNIYLASVKGGSARGE